MDERPTSGRTAGPELPEALRTGIEELLEASQRQRVGAAAERVRDAYRSRGPGASRAARTSDEVAAYATYRLPATYAAAAAVFARVRERRPGWSPASVLDLGAGPGGASWAAAAAWPEIERFDLVEAEAAMISAGVELARRAPGAALREASWSRAEIDGIEARAADLVLVSYVLSEVAEARVEPTALLAWGKAHDTVIFVEPGTPVGYRRALAARAAVLAAGGHTLAPCPHDAACPLREGDWCHFATRLPRSRAHRAVKRVALGFEDEKLSYAVLTRADHGRAAARVIRPPRPRSGHVLLTTCEQDGIHERVVPRSRGSEYRTARKLAWGDEATPGGTG